MEESVEPRGSHSGLEVLEGLEHSLCLELSSCSKLPIPEWLA